MSLILALLEEGTMEKSIYNSPIPQYFTKNPGVRRVILIIPCQRRDTY